MEIDPLEMLLALCRGATTEKRNKMLKKMDEEETKNFWKLLEEVGYHKSDNSRLKPGSNNSF